MYSPHLNASSSCDDPIYNVLIAFIIGALGGVVVAVLINCTLIELITQSQSFFSEYFGILFLIIALLLSYRLLTTTHPHAATMLLLTILMALSAVGCLLLPYQVFRAQNVVVRAVAYSTVATALTFALLFSVIDLFAAVRRCLQTDESAVRYARHISAVDEIHLLAAAAAAMGIAFGILFAVFGLDGDTLVVAVSDLSHIAIPIGAIIGGIFAALSVHYANLDDSAAYYNIREVNDGDNDRL